MEFEHKVNIFHIIFKNSPQNSHSLKSKALQCTLKILIPNTHKSKESSFLQHGQSKTSESSAELILWSDVTQETSEQESYKIKSNEHAHNTGSMGPFSWKKNRKFWKNEHKIVVPVAQRI